MKKFWSYVGYGVAACVLLAIPLVAVQWLLENLPLVDKIGELLQRIEAPALGVVLGVVGAILFLALLGFVVRRFLWDALSRIPVLGTLITSGQQLASFLGTLDRESRELVVWVSLRFYRSLGIVMSRTTDEDGTEYATVYLLSSSGQFQGNQIVSVKARWLVYPGWTVDEAIVFSSSGGALVPPAGGG